MGGVPPGRACRSVLDLARRAGGPFHRQHVRLRRGLERVCLVLHKKVGRWLQPGGHLEAGDATVGSAAAREAQEETGLLGLALLPGVVHLSHHALNSNFGSCRSHLDVRFAAVAAQDTVPVCSAESQDVQWWPVDALPPDTDDELRTVIPRIRDQLLEAHPLH